MAEGRTQGKWFWVRNNRVCISGVPLHDVTLLLILFLQGSLWSFGERWQDCTQTREKSTYCSHGLFLGAGEKKIKTGSQVWLRMLIVWVAEHHWKMGISKLVCAQFRENAKVLEGGGRPLPGKGRSSSALDGLKLPKCNLQGSLNIGLSRPDMQLF